jgi:hypothetical protein
MEDIIGDATATNVQGPLLTNTAQCDTVFGGVNGAGANCSSTSGQAVTERVDLTGPGSSTDQSPTFTSAVTWMAVP